MSNRDVVGQIVNASGSGMPRRLRDCLRITVVMHHPLAPAPLRGRSAIRDGEQALFDAFSDVDIKVTSKLSEGQRYAVEVVLSATNTRSIDLGNGPCPADRASNRGAVGMVFDFGADGLVVAESDYFDTATLMSQLGLES